MSTSNAITNTSCTIKFKIQSLSMIVLQDLESKKALFYIFDSNGSAVEKLRKPLFYKS